MALAVSLPNNWRPRPDQMPFWGYLEQGGTRLDIVAHRRWGKDDISLHWTATAAHQKIGTYWHMLPEAAQARKAIWDAVNPRTGKRRIDEAFPPSLRASTREQDMFIRFKNGSTWQVIGSDNYNSLVGSPPVGVVFSEWSLANPSAWTYLRPILAENGGWSVFIWTPRGRNHATRAFDGRALDSYWCAKKVPAAQVRPGMMTKDGGYKFPKTLEEFEATFELLTPVFSIVTLYQELKEIVGETGSEAEGMARFGQEYLVDFDAPVPGAYYADQIQIAQNEGRIGYFPYTPGIPVDSAWDLGMDDYTAIWFMQRVSPHYVNAIGYYETGGIGFDDGAGGGIIKEAFGDPNKSEWKWGMHYLPHDVAVRELGAGGRSRRQVLNSLGIRPIRVGVARDPEERITAARKLLPFVRFHADATAVGVDHLKQFRKKFNKTLGQFVGPLHDEHSHGSDAFGEFAVNAPLPKPKTVVTTKTPPPFGNPTKSILRSLVPNWKVQ